jgi:glutathione S-transferase
MKLFYNPPSPYARKVLVFAHEKRMIADLKLIPTDPWKDPSELLAAAPLAKVPALATDYGLVISESTAICTYLDHLDEPSITDTDPQLLSRTGLAQGLIDAAFAIVVERRRPVEKQWQEWIDRQKRAIERVLPRLSFHAGRFDLGDITLACGLAYLDFRLPEIGWRKSHHELATWFDEINRRPSMQATLP